jgi:hypothetical protein
LASSAIAVFTAASRSPNSGSTTSMSRKPVPSGTMVESTLRYSKFGSSDSASKIRPGRAFLYHVD